MASSDAMFEVVGGAAKGGLVVRAGLEPSSEELPGRLSTGAVVLALEQDFEAERMLYQLVEGSGPESGWVSTAFKGKALLVPVEDEVSTEEADSMEQSSTDGVTSEEEASDLAMQLYCARFGEAEADGEDVTTSSLKLGKEDEGKELESEACADLAQDLSIEEPAEADSDETMDSGLVLCKHCRLPVGQVAYAAAEGEEGVLHGECMAQLMLGDLQKAEQERQQKVADEKKARREEYDIGWNAAAHVPHNAGPAARLSCPVPQGMSCLVYNEESRSVSLAATVEPSAAVNLEYLSTALEVRRRENREPLFSLDPVDMESEFFDPKRSMLVKRFEPAWLAGTSVGEVLFQSDYHLKELSMGEYEQPVVGMKSCHDFSNVDAQEWSAREWFVVRKAEVRRSGDNVLMPFVKMGVEAREQIRGENGLEDVPTTKPNHPLVKYAEMFTHNFDLIAERKSVVYHLRELAKASVLAKFLMEGDIDLDDTWFNLASGEEEACCLEIPQLWNDRSHSQIRVQDGAIVNADSDFNASSQSLYGGVQFGLDKFQLSGARQPARMMSAGLAARQFVQPARHLSATLSAGLATRQFQRSFGPMGVQPARVSAGVGLDKFALSGARQPARMMSAGLAARQFVQPARHLSATLSAGLATRQFQRSFGPMGVQPARVAGVDLNLDEFNLSAPTDDAREDVCVLLDTGADISGAFWANIDGEFPSMFSEEDKNLLQKVFNPKLSDRREDGDCFVPPDTSFAYVQKLRSLVKEEEAMQQQRKEHFLSKAFVASEPGPLFPSTWASSVEIARDAASKQGFLEARPEYKAQTHMFEQALKTAVPEFAKVAEDGTSFRIYKIGSLEVRTFQEHDGEEVIGMVFSTRPSVEPSKRQSVKDSEKIVKVTEYVERAVKEHRCYVVVETDARNVVVAERLADGSLKREVNPVNFDDRNSLAKVVRTADCKVGKATLADISRGQSLYSTITGDAAECGFQRA